MLSTNAFNYVDVLGKAADASWKRENILSNNIANVDTPRYKRKDLNFEGVLKTQLMKNGGESLDQRINSTDFSKLVPSVYTDLQNYSYRLDANNVDIDSEETEFASEQIRYMGISTGMNGQFNRMKTVLN